MTAVPGGRYIRDPKTGRLKPLPEGAPIPSPKASDPAAPAPATAKKGK